MTHYMTPITGGGTLKTPPPSVGGQFSNFSSWGNFVLDIDLRKFESK